MPIEKLVKSYTVEVKHVVLYLNGLEKIIEIFKEISENVEIMTEEYKLDNLDEIKDTGEEVLRIAEEKCPSGQSIIALTLHKHVRRYTPLC